ncbi:hypothetical protein H9Q72_013843 [Fusarium xylarioides]|uniref:Uncharacterized protein n=1 Tax=Fusarium xylarioides TaxID=221167 RepID=A0A9P7L1Q3_9HYPO|nr:hypothetical protein H9Q72_013843 [Fusarium xylarioides]
MPASELTYATARPTATVINLNIGDGRNAAQFERLLCVMQLQVAQLPRLTPFRSPHTPTGAAPIKARRHQALAPFDGYSAVTALKLRKECSELMPRYGNPGTDIPRHIDPYDGRTDPCSIISSSDMDLLLVPRLGSCGVSMSLSRNTKDQRLLLATELKAHGDTVPSLEMADKSINDVGDKRPKRSLPTDSSESERDALLARFMNGQLGGVTYSHGRWSESAHRSTGSGSHLQDRGSLDKDPVRDASSPSPGENFSARNREEWIAIWDQREQEGRGLQGTVRSFDTNDPHSHKPVQGILFDVNPTVLEAVNAKRRRVGNSLCNYFEGLPAVPEGPQPSQPASTLLLPRPTAGEPSSRQQQLALPPVNHREASGEPPGRSGSGPGDGGERQVKGKGKQAEDVETGVSAPSFSSCLIGTHFREMPGAFVDISPEELERLGDEEAEQESEDEDEGDVVGED